MLGAREVRFCTMMTHRLAVGISVQSATRAQEALAGCWHSADKNKAVSLLVTFIQIQPKMLSQTTKLFSADSSAATHSQ
jgi:hypothetical protein